MPNMSMVLDIAVNVNAYVERHFEIHEHHEQYYKEDLQMFKKRQLYIPHYGRGRYAYDIVTNYLSESFI